MITPDNKKEYKKYVEDIDETSYIIRADKMKTGQQVACSDDKDMLVEKNDDGTVTLIKSCYRKNCFH